MTGGHRSRSRHGRKTRRKNNDTDEEERDDDDDDEGEEEEEPTSSRRITNRRRRKSVLNKIDNSHLSDRRKPWAEPLSCVVGGKPAIKGQFPFQVAVTFLRENGMAARGGGSIISACWILTAAHLCKDVKSGIVSAGAYPTANDAQQRVEVDIVVMQDAFRLENQIGPFIIHDIALLHLKTPLKFGSMVKPIKLPTHADRNKDFANKTAILVGWGKTCEEDMRPFVGSSTLNFAYEKILSNDEAAKLLQVSSIPNQLIAAIGTHGKACSCNGDSGGPLIVMVDNNKPMLVGVVSHRIGACGGPVPHLLTRVTMYQDWIAKITSMTFHNNPVK